MPMDGLMVHAIAKELNDTLALGRVDKITQPERDQVHLLIRAGGENHRLVLSCSANHARAHISAQPVKSMDTPPQFCMMLRKHLMGGRLVGVYQQGLDRALEVHIESMDEMGDLSCKRLIVEIMGRHSNLILVDAQGRILDCARKVTADISRVREVLPGLPYELPPAQDKLNMDEHSAQELAEKLTGCAGQSLDKALLGCVSGLSQQAARELSWRLFGDERAQSGAWTRLADSVAQDVKRFFDRFYDESEPTIYMDENGDPADVTCIRYQSRPQERQRKMDSMSHALDEYYFLRDKADRLRQKASHVTQAVRTALERCEKKLALQLQRQQEVAQRDELRIYGELINASLHAIKKGDAQAVVPNYFAEDMAEVSIPLDETLSPAQNAQRYFKRYAKARAAAELLGGQIEQNQKEIDYLSTLQISLETISEENELEELRRELEASGYVRRVKIKGKPPKLPPSEPAVYTAPSGAPVFVGKNNAQNDRLTAEADGDDLWLHTKNIPGSHVVLKQLTPEILDDDLLYAARLAARFSKAKAGSHVPVDYTYRKYVKKPSGSKPGYVIYSQNWTVYVDP